MTDAQRSAVRQKIEQPFYLVKYRVGRGPWTKSGGVRFSELWALKEGRRLALLPLVSSVRVWKCYPAQDRKEPEAVYVYPQ